MDTSVAKGWTLGVNCRHMDFGKRKVTILIQTNPAGPIEEWRLSTDENVVSMWSNVRFPSRWTVRRRCKNRLGVDKHLK